MLLITEIIIEGLKDQQASLIQKVEIISTEDARKLLKEFNYNTDLVSMEWDQFCVSRKYIANGRYELKTLTQDVSIKTWAADQR